MLKAVLWMISSLLFSANAALWFAKGDIIGGVLNSLLAITGASLSMIIAREGK
jgi:hypothetical protein